MCHRQVLLCHVLCILVCYPRILCSFGLCFSIAELRNVPVVVGLHLLVEDLRLTRVRLVDEIAIEQCKNCVTDLLELTFHLSTVLLCIFGLLLIAFCLLL